jgi:basic amino acid/polyamine antiporter, APA family
MSTVSAPPVGPAAVEEHEPRGTLGLGAATAAQITWRPADHRQLHTLRFARDVGVAAVGLVFSVLFIVYSRNTGELAVWKEYLPFIFAGIAFLAGIPIYLRHRTSMSEPAPVPAWRR